MPTLPFFTNLKTQNDITKKTKLKVHHRNGHVSTRRRRTRIPKVRTLVCLVFVRTDRQRTAFFENSGKNPDSEQNRDRQNPDRKTLNRKSGQNPDSRPDTIFWKSGQKRDNYRTRKVLSADVW